MTILGAASISLRMVSVSRSSDRNHAVSTGPNVPDSTAITQFARVVSEIARLRATSTRGRSDVFTNYTASAPNSGGYFDGRPISGLLSLVNNQNRGSTDAGQTVFS